MNWLKADLKFARQKVISIRMRIHNLPVSTSAFISVHPRFFLNPHGYEAGDRRHRRVFLDAMPLQ
jgi:hypothetical protein